MWPCHADATMPRSTQTTKGSLPSNSRATCRTDPQSNRAANPYPRRTRSSRQPHEARGTSIRRQKATASADRAGKVPGWSRCPRIGRRPTMTDESLHVAVVDIGRLANLEWVVEGASVKESGTDIDFCI